MWAWGFGNYGALGINQSDDAARKSSPTQVPGTTWASCKAGAQGSMATRTDGTLWTFGINPAGRLGDNSTVNRSSPTQIPGTTWSTTQSDMWTSEEGAGALKTDGTLWVWGNSTVGEVAQNNTTSVSSPIQIPGTTWMAFTGGPYFRQGIKQG